MLRDRLVPRRDLLWYIIPCLVLGVQWSWLFLPRWGARTRAWSWSGWRWRHSCSWTLAWIQAGAPDN